jgi:phage baseplate assembly protein gpV
MSSSFVPCGNIKIAPFRLIDLLELKIEKKINQHTRLYLTGVVSEDLKDSYVEKTKSETQVEVSILNEGNSTPLFTGIALNVEVKAIRNIHYIKVEAVSNTYTLDVSLKSRSFQNKGMPYSDLIKKVISDYSGADFMDACSEGKTIEKFTMQYEETDWEFIKRMASRFNTGLVPDCISDKPKFFFGVKEKAGQKPLEEYNYCVRKKISDFRNSSQNYIKGIDENDYVYYEVETGDFLEIGSKVDFKGKSLYVYDAVCRLKEGVLINTYNLTFKKGLSQNNIHNDRIIGLSIEGTVLEVSKDNVKVHLEIDQEQNAGEAWWFSYSANYTAEGNSGWYCMPELNDHVLVYFPDNKEENGISIASVRKDSEKGTNNKVDNPDVKYFRTKSGKELMFSPQEILISAKDGETFIKLSESDGILIYSTKPVKVMTKEDLVMSADKNVIISAKDKINMTCKESSITMDGSVYLKGKEVKTN